MSSNWPTRLYSRRFSLRNRCRIDDLYSRYCWAINEGDADGWAECFTPDGLFVPAYGPVQGEYRGKAELTAFAADPRRNQLTRHWTSNIRPYREGDVIRSACYCLLIDYAGDLPRLLTHVVYHDVLTIWKGSWRFVERRPRIDRSVR